MRHQRTKVDISGSGTLAEALRGTREATANDEGPQQHCPEQCREDNNPGCLEIDPAEARNFQSRLNQINAGNETEKIDLHSLDPADLRA